MKKNVKVLGAAAAALLAVAPVVASATTANASSVTVNAGATNTTPDVLSLNVNASLDANAGQTFTQAASTVKLFPQNGVTVQGFSTANVTFQQWDATNKKWVAATSNTVNAGVKYRLAVSGVSFEGLTTGRTYNLGLASFAPSAANESKTATAEQSATNESKTATAEQLKNGGTFYSAPFNLTQAGNSDQPYFTNQSAAGDPGSQLANGAVAYVRDGQGVDTSNVTLDAQHILQAAEENVSLNPAGSTSYTTTEEDVISQLAAQNVAVKNGVYTLPENGFHVTLTAKSLLSNKTVSVVVPFAGTNVNNSLAGYPKITYNTDNANASQFSPNFANLKPVQNNNQIIKATKLVRTVNVNSSFTNTDATSAFKAVTDNSAASNIDLAVLSNPVNTNIPGQYTVTVQATDWTTGKTSRISYTVQVGDSDTTYQIVNYPAEYGVNVWSISGNTASFTGERVAGKTRVATGETRTINGVSYTKVKVPNSSLTNTWIQTQYLGNHSTEKPSNGETAMRGVAKVTFNGKGAVRLLNAEGHYVDQYVKKGSSFKVWAEKTVNGQHLYRIGSQSQWIPAKYVSVK